MLFVTFQLIDVAPRRVQVRDRTHEVIGEASIPHDYGSDLFCSITLLIVSGIQLWLIQSVGKKLYADQKSK